MSSISAATVSFAATSSPAMKIVSRSGLDDLPPFSRVFQPIVLNALTRRAPGSRFATSSLEVLSPRLITRPRAEYGFIASITIFPVNSSAGGSCSLFLHGIAKRTASPNATASAADAARTFGPRDATSWARDEGPREFATATSCPASANSFAAVPPMRPAPTTPIRMLRFSCASLRTAPEIWIFGFASGLDAFHSPRRLGPPQQAQERLRLRSRKRDHIPAAAGGAGLPVIHDPEDAASRLLVHRHEPRHLCCRPSVPEHRLEDRELLVGNHRDLVAHVVQEGPTVAHDGHSRWARSPADAVRSNREARGQNLGIDGHARPQ